MPIGARLGLGEKVIGSISARRGSSSRGWVQRLSHSPSAPSSPQCLWLHTSTLAHTSPDARTYSERIKAAFPERQQPGCVDYATDFTTSPRGLVEAPGGAGGT